ncbi:MAG: CPBP family intramembrane metalloprotease [Maricaulis sp.]|jgi:membrane protease YdiL (CAAX protease family)|uniref:CPBP family glutamic-type intramembrane protease n=1 Tax=Maricaulis sp. TaxID=1486257 RepID=UPI001B21B67D|nr:type II CAAX endopeptidase family protein [Maricaulis sp.]MBO6730605.1 CPBP family intramembrane metalloprotease [Maricaulis sp.]MBO6848824.1 CPBP family intramembrane metalloprotease [Maricaulis sp.]MBO6878889.1 CPBP family intramembrane metalloprotease [Maricaulis sp.]
MAGRELFAPRRAKNRRTWTIASIVLLAVFLVGGFLLARELSTFFGWDALMAEYSWGPVAYQLGVSFGLVSLVCLLWVFIFERRGIGAIGLNGRFLVRFLRGYVVGLGFLAGVVGIIAYMGGYEVEGSGALAVAALVPIGVILLGFIIQGSTEEILFRGWLMSVISSRHGAFWAILITSVLFGLLHGFNIPPGHVLYLGVTNIVLVGLFLALYALKEGSIWGVCGFHASWNWLLGVGFGLEVSGGHIVEQPLIVDLASTNDVPWWITGGPFGPEASVVTAAVFATGCVIVLLFGRAADFGVEAAVAQDIPGE